MDIVLDVCDRFLFDKFWAQVLPLTQSTITELNKNATAVLASPIVQTVKQVPIQRWQYEPSTQYFSFPPTEAAWQSQWGRDYLPRQFIELFLITWLFGVLLYFFFSSLSYYFVFDKSTFNHPKFLKNQIKLEIIQAQKAMPVMAILTAAFFTLEVRGYAKLYDNFSEEPFFGYNLLQFPIFLLFTDFFIYFIHRGLHHPRIYKHLHKPHHKWIMPTPYASHAFHPLDGFAQSVPYHVFPFIFPLQKFAYIALFAFINIWTIMIHDGEYVANNSIINGAACHTGHHVYYQVNLGQYTTLWDRLCGTYRAPDPALFKKETKMAVDQWHKDAEESDRIQKLVEGKVDFREYRNDSKKSQ